MCGQRCLRWRPVWRFCPLVALLLVGGQRLPAAETPPTAEALLDSGELAARIDQVLAAAWAAEGITPAPPADDAEFMRRAYLDLVGKIPSVAEAREFLDDRHPDKRRQLVENLLQRGAHAAHFANTWRGLLLSGASNNQEVRGLVPQFESWLRLRFAANMRYDRMASELMTASPSAGMRQVAAGSVSVPSPIAFYQANESKPEQLAGSTSRVFLGLQVDCAQCHDHPFSHWTRKEFWSFAVFFSDLEPSAAAEANVELPPVDGHRIRIPDTDLVVEARYLDGTEPDWRSQRSKRALLAEWATQRDNPYFARAAVNRLWDHFFGRGFVNPVDDLDPANPAMHPELFAEVARQFALHDYDLKYLIRAITSTRAYQLSSRASEENEDQLRHFARIPLRRMTAEQLFDSISQATGYREAAVQSNDLVILDTTSARAQFLSKFSDQSVPRTEAETSIQQALSLMNGALIASATDLEDSKTLAAVVESPFLDRAGKIEALFLATLSRPPADDELAEFAAYVERAQASRSANAGYTDVFWALLNCAEFCLNH